MAILFTDGFDAYHDHFDDPASIFYLERPVPDNVSLDDFFADDYIMVLIEPEEFDWRKEGF